LLTRPTPPVRRLIMVEAVKWVDVVLKGVPYDVNESFMQELFKARARLRSIARFPSRASSVVRCTQRAYAFARMRTQPRWWRCWRRSAATLRARYALRRAVGASARTHTHAHDKRPRNDSE
jgi:hypothetical protein